MRVRVDGRYKQQPVLSWRGSWKECLCAGVSCVWHVLYLASREGLAVGLCWGEAGTAWEPLSGEGLRIREWTDLVGRSLEEIHAKGGGSEWKGFFYQT